MTSVNTNSGALTALASLRSLATRVEVNSKQLQTGYRVADLMDDSAVFAVAQGVRSGLKAHVSVQSSLQQGLGLVDVTLAGMRNISETLVDLRATLIKAADGSLSDAQRDTYKADAQRLHAQILASTLAATYTGRNQMLTSSTDVQFVADISGRTITVGTYGINPHWSDLGTAIDAIADQDTATAAYNLVDPLEAATHATIAEFAATRRQFELQMRFNEDLVDAVKKALGALVDADVAGAAALSQSLQVQEQLAISALSIANRQPNAIVRLYR